MLLHHSVCVCMGCTSGTLLRIPCLHGICAIKRLREILRSSRTYRLRDGRYVITRKMLTMTAFHGVPTGRSGRHETASHVVPTRWNVSYDCASHGKAGLSGGESLRLALPWPIVRRRRKPVIVVGYRVFYRVKRFPVVFATKN